MYELQVPEWDSPDAVRQGFLDALDQIELGDKLGWSYVWAVEHHNLPGWSSSSAPEVLFGAISQRTKNIRIGHGVALLPKNFNHPFRVAERVATLDLISGGRVELGTGRAVTQQELDGFEVPPDETQAQWKEGIEVLVKAFDYEPVYYKGDYYQITSGPVIVPKPYQQPHPPLWLAGTNPESFEKAGLHGLGMLAFLTETPENVKPRLKIYKDALKKAKPIGKFVNDRVALMVQTYCAETREQAFADVEEPIRRSAELIKDLFLPWAQKPREDAKSYAYLAQTATEETLNARAGARADDLEQRAAESTLAVGDPDDLIRIFREWEAVEVDQLLTWIQFGGLEQEKIMKSMKLIGEHVIPELKKKR